MSSKELTELRNEIDSLDDQLVGLLNRRAQLVRAVGEWKARHGKQVHDPGREKAILERIARLNPGPLSRSDIQEMMSQLIRAFRAFEERTRVNPPGAAAPCSVSIIGTGLMGGSLALALARFPEVYQIQGFDLRGRRAIEGTAVAGAIRGFATTPEKALDADIVVLAMPVREILRFLKKHRRAFQPGSVVTDLGSTKDEICRSAWKLLPSSVTFVGGHPLAGKSVSGAAAADPLIFSGRPFVLVPQSRPRDPRAVIRAVAKLEKLALALGAQPQVWDSREHDRVLALTSHLPQMVSVALALAASRQWRKRNRAILHGPAFAEMTRLALSDYRMWLDIARTNRAELDSALAAFIQALSGLRASIKRGGFSAEFRIAKHFRAKYLK